MGREDDEHEMDYGTYTTKKPKKPILSISQIVLILVVTVIGISLYVGVSGFVIIPEELVPVIRTVEEPRFQCEQWLEEGKFLLNKNYFSEDVSLWNKDDREKFIMLENQYASNCVITDEITANLPECTEMFIRIQELIDKMEDRKLGSLPFQEQREYDLTYNEYFKKRCDVIADKIQKSNDFIDFNKTRNG